jgi:hypothetical protein
VKTYRFPCGGTTGKCDSWDSFIDFELTDDEAARLEASARAEFCWHLDEDESISDICQKIERFIFEENKRMMIGDGRLSELRADWKYAHPDADEDDIPSDDDLVRGEMGSWSVSYPQELQDFEEEEEEEE